GNSYLEVGYQDNNNGLTPQNGNGIIGSSGLAFSFHATVPITQLQSSGFSFRPDQVANSWSGYHDGTCSWSFTGSSFADPSDDGTCAFVERNNSNFGTVTSFGAKKPGIVFTPSRAGRYYVCAIAAGVGSGTAS